MAEVKLNLYQKMAKIRKPAEIVQKNRKGFNYTYVDESAILSQITGLMTRYGVSLIPKITPGCTTVEPYVYTKTKTARDGKIIEEKVNEIMVTGEMEWVWINDENPEEQIIVPWVFVGSQADASQAFGSALTYSSRYFLLKYFNIATSDDDPDEFRRRQREAEKTEDKLIANEIIESIDEMVQAHMAAVPEDRTKVTNVIKKYAKKDGKPSANYFVIDSSEVAASLKKELEVLINGEKKEGKK